MDTVTLATPSITLNRNIDHDINKTLLSAIETNIFDILRYYIYCSTNKRSWKSCQIWNYSTQLPPHIKF